MYRNNQKLYSELYGVIFGYRQGYGRARAVLSTWAPPWHFFKDIDVKHKVLTVGLISGL
jgi:hypothetical protein